MNTANPGKTITKSEALTDPAYGSEPEKRNIKDYLDNGIVNIDKPAGPSSHQVTAWVKDLLNLEKTGHSGTLDPKVTGVLPVALGNATKIIKILLLSDKEYVCLMTLHDEVPEEKLKKTLEYFKGPLLQTPPMKSAVKKELRIRNIYEISYLEKKDKEVLFKVRCEAGTYIRKLCHDIGLVLGTGAHMKELRRTKAGPFTEDSLVKLQDLRDAEEYYKENKDETELRRLIKPVEYGANDLKKIWIKDSAVSAVCHGANLNAPGISMIQEGITKNELIAVMSLKKELVALGKATADTQKMLELEKGETVRPERVIMKPDTYPERWHKKEAK